MAGRRGMLLHGTFNRFTRRNERTGESEFRVALDDGRLVACTGTVQRYPRLIPLELEAEALPGQPGLPAYAVSSARACGYSAAVMERFLLSGEFREIGKASARAMVEQAGPDLFAAASRGADAAASSISAKNGAAVKRAMERLRSYAAFEELHSCLSSYGAGYAEASAMFEEHGDGAWEAIARDPYAMMGSGGALAACDKIALEQGMEHCDRSRMRGIVKAAMAAEVQDGNTRTPFHRLCARIWRMEREAESPYRSEPLFIAEEAMAGWYRLQEAGGEVYVSRAWEYDAEKSIRDSVARLQASAVPLLGDGIDIAGIEEACGVRYSKGQRAAFRLLGRSGIKIITGGPGTGKTTVLNGIITGYRAARPHGQIALCAPTGCAARRMQECTGMEAVTIHKLLRIRPYEDIAKPPQEKLGADLVVVDECSMIDTYVMARLLSSIKNGAALVLLGDKDQLPSVGAGNVFADILADKAIEAVHLGHIFRQDGRSLIVDNSQRVIAGRLDLATGKSFVIRTYRDEGEMVRAAVSIAGKMYKKGNGTTKVYSPSKKRKFASGTINLNELLSAAQGRSGPSITYGDYTFHVGDEVVFNRNDYKKGFYNGMSGVVRDVQDHGGSCRVSIEADGERYQLSGKDLGSIELAYAVTAHKSQGGECDTAVILVPRAPASLLKRRLLYVEITRARKNVALLCEEGALQRAVGTKGEILRETGLKDLLTGKAV